MIIATSTVSLANSQPTEETDIYDVISSGIGSAEAYLYANMIPPRMEKLKTAFALKR